MWSWRTGFLIASVRLKASVNAVLFSNDGSVNVRFYCAILGLKLYSEVFSLSVYTGACA